MVARLAVEFEFVLRSDQDRAILEQLSKVDDTAMLLY